MRIPIVTEVTSFDGLLTLPAVGSTRGQDGASRRSTATQRLMRRRVSSQTSPPRCSYGGSATRKISG